MHTVMQIDLGFKGIFEKIPDLREQGFMRANTILLGSQQGFYSAWAGLGFQSLPRSLHHYV